MKLEFTSDATADLDDILDYSIAQWGLARGFDYVTEIRNRAMLLADGFHPGATADDVQQGLRRQVSGSHVIWFRREPDRIVVIRVLHQSRDAGRWLG
ncbi:type II toxin-antitoxin system RelE/ParE family toxin [Tabrizicola oligotrophica]|uniref:Type II toxin-antitoxin system RelE/ParE family toxin n=1 Tax=Tabrizicola oligotrophica TaxID=2710650 RepID=A0A6M0QVR1_9RHOB|nr:type II toxin-antitoxin system RelE/ParE family toxin [Tabrizicola oligotrophica]NEY90753.1 type II toxin-antitoxin system RelE/ParE family toxin [Tabrizicola oligotrophica]